jgi:glycosyltransferase involved in cell wall biosynthesis
VLEFVTDGINGLVVSPSPTALADAMDRLFLDRAHTARMGEANNRRLSELGINWDTVVESLTS